MRTAEATEDEVEKRREAAGAGVILSLTHSQPFKRNPMKPGLAKLVVIGLCMVVALQAVWTLVMTASHNAQLKAQAETFNAQLKAHTEVHNAQLKAQTEAHNAQLLALSEKLSK